MMKNSITKVCSRCETEKPLSEFAWRSDTGKYRNECKRCQKDYWNGYYQNHADEKKGAAKAHSKAYYAENRERKKRYAVENQDKIKARMHEYHKEYYKENKSKILLKNARNFVGWLLRNPHKRKEYNNNRRAKQLAVGGKITNKQWQEVLDKYGNKCLRCGRTDVELTMDHVIPLDPGTNTVDNIQPLCKPCNSSKGRRTIDYR
jgi:5-methylcytosine-specific restriction endonuclease McrA